MDEAAVLARLLSDETQPVQVVEPTRAGLLLNNGGVLFWPEEDTGVVLASDFEGDILGESWPDEEGYEDLLRLFEQHRGPQEPRDRPRLRVVWGDEEEQ